jgi:hypothetical protein
MFTEQQEKDLSAASVQFGGEGCGGLLGRRVRAERGRSLLWISARKLVTARIGRAAYRGVA